MRIRLGTRYFLLLSFTLLTAFAITSCNKDISVSLNPPDENMGILVNDTMTVHASTHQLLHLPTDRKGVLLVGKASPQDIGSAIASAYFRLQIQNVTNDFPTDAVFDSVNLEIKPAHSRYYFGDTTTALSFSVHQVTEEIKTTDLTTAIDQYNRPVYVTAPGIFSHDTFAYNATALGKVTAKAGLQVIDTIKVRLQDNFGKDLFDKIKTGDYRLKTQDEFQRYIQGLSLIPDAKNKIILGLNDTINVRLHYSYIGADGFRKKEAKTVAVSSNSMNYNNIAYDRSGTPYATLNETKRTIPSAETAGRVFIQSGTGVVAKIVIPSLSKFIEQENMAINKAQLIVETTSENKGPFPTAPQLSLMIANKSDVPVSYVVDPFRGAILTANFIPGNQLGTTGTYTFDLIEYLKTVNNPANADRSLLISASNSDLFNALNRTAIAVDDANRPKIKLNIVYTKFK